MNEYEAAFFGALLILMKCVVEAGADKIALAGRLRMLAEDARGDKRLNTAKTLEMLAQSAASERLLVPASNSLTVIEGGKDKLPV